MGSICSLLHDYGWDLNVPLPDYGWDLNVPCLPDYRWVGSKCPCYLITDEIWRFPTCQTPTTALHIRIVRITNGSTNAVTWSSLSSNQAKTYKFQKTKCLVQFIETTDIIKIWNQEYKIEHSWVFEQIISDFKFIASYLWKSILQTIKNIWNVFQYSDKFIMIWNYNIA